MGQDTQHRSATYPREFCQSLLDQLAQLAYLLLPPPPHHCLQRFPHDHLYLHKTRLSEQCHSLAVIWVSSHLGG